MCYGLTNNHVSVPWKISDYLRFHEGTQVSNKPRKIKLCRGSSKAWRFWRFTSLSLRKLKLRSKFKNCIQKRLDEPLKSRVWHGLFIRKSTRVRLIGTHHTSPIMKLVNALSIIPQLADTLRVALLPTLREIIRAPSLLLHPSKLSQLYMSFVWQIWGDGMDENTQGIKKALITPNAYGVVLDIGAGALYCFMNTYRCSQRFL